jgi:hypothetical protein
VFNQLSTMLWRSIGERRYNSTILDLSTRRTWVASFTPRFILGRKNPWYPLDRRLCGPQDRSGRCGDEKNPCLCRESNPSPARNPSLHRLSYPDSYGSRLSNLITWRQYKISLYCSGSHDKRWAIIEHVTVCLQTNAHEFWRYIHLCVTNCKHKLGA